MRKIQAVLLWSKGETVNRVRINHHNVAESLVRVNIIDRLLCESGEYNESIDHHAHSQCAKYVEKRKSLLKQSQSLGLYGALLHNQRVKPLSMYSNFLKIVTKGIKCI